MPPELPFSSKMATSLPRFLGSEELGGVLTRMMSWVSGSSPIMADLSDSQRHNSESGVAFPSASSCSESEPTPTEVQGELHGEQPVRDIKDIIEAGRDFSDLTNPGSIRHLCVLKIAGWQSAGVAEEEVQVAQIMAGLTNQLFRVFLEAETAPGILPRQVLFRVYGTSVGDLYDPAFELEVFKTLSENESAPRMVAEFPGGRIEEYILGPALLMKDMLNPAVLCAVASILGKFHKLHQTVPKIGEWNKGESFVWKALTRWSTTAWTLMKAAQSTINAKENETLPIDRRGSLESVGSTESLVRDKAKKLSSEAKQAMVNRLSGTGLEDMLNEARSLESLLCPPDAPPTILTEIAFCHNDVQENNILVTGTRLRLIDFEYADFNLPAFDIANFFCESTINYCVNEYPYFTHDVDPMNFPSDEHLRLFASIYLSERAGRHVMPSDADQLQAFVEAIHRFVLASHLLWGFWSIIRAPQAATSSDFDFLLYAKSRFQAYKLWKAHLVEKGYVRIPEAGH